MVAKHIHFGTTNLASIGKSRTRGALTEKGHAQAKLERNAKLGGKQGKAQTCDRGARSQSLACGIAQASIRLLLRVLDLAVSLWNNDS
jgi:hypothetical protein